MAKKKTPAKPAKTAEPRLTALPAGYALLSVGRGYLRPVRLITTPTHGAQDASPTNVYYRELSRDKTSTEPALCASEPEALDVIAENLEWLREQAALATQDSLWAASASKRSANTTTKTTNKRTKGDAA